MGAFLFILGIPLLGVLLFLFENARRTGGTPGVRSVGRIGVLTIGLVLVFSGILTLAEALGSTFGSIGNRSLLMLAATILTQFMAAALMLWAGRCAVRVIRLPTQPATGSASLAEDQAAESIRLSGALLALVPVLLLGVFAVVLAVPLVLWGVAFWSGQRARQAQFLWTIALAERQQLPLDEEVEAFAAPLWPRQRVAYASVASRLRDGLSLGESLEMSFGVLPPSVANEIRLAEDSGMLASVLSELARRMTRSLSRNQFDSAMAVTCVYGWGLLSALVLVVGFVSVWIVPKYSTIFVDFDFELPPLTSSVVTAGNLFSENFLVLMALLGLPVIAAMIGALIYFVEWRNLNIPLLMQWFPRRDAPSLLRTLSYAIDAKLPLSEVISDLSQRHVRSDMRQRLARIAHQVECGEEWQKALWRERLIRSVEADALEAADRAGNLPWAMKTLADSIDRSTQHRVRFWLEVMRPMAVIGIGLIVAWFVVAMFLPLVQLIAEMTG